MVEQERRTHERVSLQRPCKLYLPSVGKYVSGSTWNVSPGGVLLQLNLPAGISAGDRLYVGIALKRRQPVLVAGEMLRAEVVRVEQTPDDRVAVAARFVGEAAGETVPMTRAA
jgi:hypothetical protein